MFHRFANYFDVPIHENPVSLFKIGLGVGLGWFTAAALISLATWFVLNVWQVLSEYVK